VSEDSKELADAGSFGMKADFHAHPSIRSEELARLMERLLKAVGDQVVQEKGFLLGHVKAFVTTPHGTLKVNLIDTDLGPEILNRLTSPEVEEGEIKFMAALVGLEDEVIEEIMEASLEILDGRLELEMEEHNHDHDNHDHH
jgi:hypothetical protein